MTNGKDPAPDPDATDPRFVSIVNDEPEPPADDPCYIDPRSVTIQCAGCGITRILTGAKLTAYEAGEPPSCMGCEQLRKDQEEYRRELGKLDSIRGL